MTVMESTKPGCISLYVVLLLPMFIQAENTHSPPTICTSSGRSSSWWEGPVPLLPRLPPQYSVRVEANIIQNSWTTEVEEHYDSINQRASASLTRNGSTTVSIFNFKTDQRYDIFPNGTCMARPTKDGMFGFATTNKQNKPTMATVNDIFRIGSKFNWTYVARETVRGIPVNHWTSCQSWVELEAKFQLDYYFSDPDYTTASGAAQVPVRAELRGQARNVDMSDDPINGLHKFQHIYEFTSFLSGPVLDEDVFQIPRGTVCSGRRDNKPFPRIPGQLELSIEIVRPDKNTYPRYVHLRYDHDSNIQEIDTTNVLNQSQEEKNRRNGGGYGNVMAATESVVKDYNSGLIYITNLVNNSCTVHKLPRHMAGVPHNQCLFSATNNSNHFVYQGQTTFRAMLVDVWSLEQNNTITEMYFLPGRGTNRFQILTGIFIKNKPFTITVDLFKIFHDLLGIDRSSEDDCTNDIHQELLASSTRSSTTKRDSLDWKLTLEINIFNYRPLLQGTTNFQISQCFPDAEISEIILFINASYDKEVASNLLPFSNSLRKVLAEKMGVSVLHLSSFVMVPSKLEPMQNSTEVTFALLGSTNTSETKQTYVMELRDALIKAMSAGITIHVECASYSKDVMVYRELYFIDNIVHGLFNNRNSSNVQSLSSKHTTDFSPHKTNSSSHTGNANSYITTHSSHTTYSQSVVAGVAIGSFALGALVCLVVTILVQSQGRVNDSLVLHEGD